MQVTQWLINIQKKLEAMELVFNRLSTERPGLKKVFEDVLEMRSVIIFHLLARKMINRDDMIQRTPNDSLVVSSYI